MRQNMMMIWFLGLHTVCVGKPNNLAHKPTVIHYRDLTR